MTESLRVRAVELVGLGLASLSVLGSQIAMTRVLSLKYASNQTFLVVSFAVLGLALGAGIASALIGRLTESNRVRLAWVGMTFFSVTMLMVLWSLHLNLASSVQVIFVPFPFAGVGLCVASIFSRRADQAGFFYASDLLGASLGAFGAAPLLDMIAAPSAILLFCVLGLGAGVLFAAGSDRKIVPGILCAGFVLGGIALGMGGPGRLLGGVPIYPDTIKDMLNYLDRDASERVVPFVEDSRWSSFGRTDVVNDVAARDRKVLFVDGGAGTSMFASEDRRSAQTQFELMTFGPRVVLGLLDANHKRNVLAIGAGGGRDVVVCRLGGAGRVRVVELNRDVVDVVRDDAGFNGAIYSGGKEGTKVEVEIGEGRHALRLMDQRFDVILLSIPVTKRGESYGGFALSESYLFTVESIGEYLDHLEDGGQLQVVCHTRQEVGRLINTYLACMNARGENAKSAMERVGVFGAQLLTVVIGKKGVDDRFWRALDIDVKRFRLADPERRWFYMPKVGAEGASAIGYSEALVAVARGDKEIVQFGRSSASSFEPDFSAVTDDRPFFYFFTRSLPPMLSTVLAASTVILVVMCGWGLVGGAGGSSRMRASVSSTEDEGVIASAGETLLWRLGVMGLGAGFMLVEIPLIQRFVLWFGHPTLALGLLLGSLLLATGIGSFLSGIWIRGRLRLTWPFAVGVGVFLLVGFTALQEAVFAGATGEFGDALARALVMAVPMGLVLGVPFPMLLTAARRVARTSRLR